ncbi:MAG: radical SAM-associated putative lipoprotein [Tannerellaceae bacterium]|nr:radical SAM-associated putative lipoprotein [Tannerellaceae bacterium]
MKKIYRPLIKGTNWALAGLLSLTGFSSCGDIIGGGSVAEYGVPWASFAIKGTVVDKASKEPIPGVEVKLALPDSVKAYYPNPPAWTTTTDSKGEFKLPDTPGWEKEPLVITDVDGEANGSYPTDTVYVDYRNAVHLGGGSGWFQGELTAIVKIELEAGKTDE